MFREDAAQHYPLKRATWGFSQPTPYSVPVLSLAIEAEEQPSAFSEDDEWPHAPSWRLDVWTRGLSESMLVAGGQFSMPECHDGFTGVIFTAFVYDEMEGTEPNIVKILRREGDKFHAFLHRPLLRILTVLIKEFYRFGFAPLRIFLQHFLKVRGQGIPFIFIHYHKYCRTGKQGKICKILCHGGKLKRFDIPFGSRTTIHRPLL